MHQDKPIINGPTFCNVPGSVLLIMTKAEARKYIEDLRREADAMEAWNEDRVEPVLPPEPVNERNPPPPKAHNDYGRWSQKVNGKYKPCDPPAEGSFRLW